MTPELADAWLARSQPFWQPLAVTALGLVVLVNGLASSPVCRVTDPCGNGVDLGIFAAVLAAALVLLWVEGRVGLAVLLAALPVVARQDGRGPLGYGLLVAAYLACLVAGLAARRAQRRMVDEWPSAADLRVGTEAIWSGADRRLGLQAPVVGRSAGLQEWGTWLAVPALLVIAGGLALGYTTARGDDLAFHERARRVDGTIVSLRPVGRYDYQLIVRADGPTPADTEWVTVRTGDDYGGIGDPVTLLVDTADEDNVRLADDDPFYGLWSLGSTLLGVLGLVALLAIPIGAQGRRRVGRDRAVLMEATLKDNGVVELAPHGADRPILGYYCGDAVGEVPVGEQFEVLVDGPAVGGWTRARGDRATLLPRTPVWRMFPDLPAEDTSPTAATGTSRRSRPDDTPAPRQEVTAAPHSQPRESRGERLAAGIREAVPAVPWRAATAAVVFLGLAAPSATDLPEAFDLARTGQPVGTVVVTAVEDETCQSDCWGAGDFVSDDGRVRATGVEIDGDGLRRGDRLRRFALTSGPDVWLYEDRNDARTETLTFTGVMGGLGLGLATWSVLAPVRRLAGRRGRGYAPRHRSA